jgi:alpha-N-arabinofuranosidase
MAQLVNVIAPIFTNETGLFRQTIYFPLQLFASNMQGTSLDVFVDCPTYDTEKFTLGLGETSTKQNKVPYLDVSATYKDGQLVVSVVNRNKDEAITADIQSQNGDFTGVSKIFEVNGPDIKTENDFGRETVKTVEKTPVKAGGRSITYSFPPHSFTMLICQLGKN